MVLTDPCTSLDRLEKKYASKLALTFGGIDVVDDSDEHHLVPPRRIDKVNFKLVIMCDILFNFASQ